jgi:hypothetical protein
MRLRQTGHLKLVLQDGLTSKWQSVDEISSRVPSLSREQLQSCLANAYARHTDVDRSGYRNHFSYRRVAAPAIQGNGKDETQSTSAMLQKVAVQLQDLAHRVAFEEKRVADIKAAAQLIIEQQDAPR